MGFKDYDKKFMLALPEDLHKVYKDIAKMKGITMNDMIIMVMRYYLMYGGVERKDSSFGA